MATTASAYNFQRTTRQILKRHRKDPASFIMHIHQHFMRFEKQDGCFMMEARTKDFLHFVRDQTLPVDLIEVFLQAGVPFFEGCLMVEVHEHRKSVSLSKETRLLDASAKHGTDPDALPMYLQEGGQYGSGHLHSLRRAMQKDNEIYPAPDGVEVYRIVLRPTVETLWSDLKTMDAKLGGLWSDEEALRIEATIVNLTAPPLCLTPDPHVTCITNLMLSSTMPPVHFPHTPNFQQYRMDKAGNKLNSVELELERSQDARRDQIMNMMKNGWATASVPKAGAGQEIAMCDSSFVPTFSRLDFLRTWRENKSKETQPMPEQQLATEPQGPVQKANAVETKKSTLAKKRKSGKNKEDAAKGASSSPSQPPNSKTNGEAVPKPRSRARMRETEDGFPIPTAINTKSKEKTVVFPGTQQQFTSISQNNPTQMAAMMANGRTMQNVFGGAQIAQGGPIVAQQPQQPYNASSFTPPFGDNSGLVLPESGTATMSAPMQPSKSQPSGSATPVLPAAQMVSPFGLANAGMQSIPSSFAAQPSMNQERDNAWFYS
ncbi:hypothetical protein MVES1_001029 [Malassezia vespertilionis]|uniref:Spt20p n=1 Tax=Malassezia vespertilionis TaxID=2020962 RepID=A0A2N1JF92_9BASI|nr:uncharacterized protein MVES1_001029 [Malassezia vespertilionis]PKI85185.1 Spt20p [Malassezia vespertilionis]WFD05697.1 hypothetical protein MVES1_001029 [Malassezia vespertilionis]